MFWSMTYAALGYIFSDQLDRVAAHVVGMGTVVVFAVAAGLGFHIVRKSARWQRFVRQFKLAQIIPEQLRDKLNGGENILIVDMQGRLDHAAEPMAIPEISPSQEVVLCCSNPSEITSAPVVLAVRKPLAGGLRAWRDGGRGP
jgi:hypothetical protein